MATSPGSPLVALRRKAFMQTFGLVGALSCLGVSVMLVGVAVFIFLGLQRLSGDEREVIGLSGDELNQLQKEEKALWITLPFVVVLALFGLCAAALIVGLIVHANLAVKRALSSREQQLRRAEKAVAAAAIAGGPKREVARSPATTAKARREVENVRSKQKGGSASQSSAPLIVRRPSQQLIVAERNASPSPT